MYKLLKQLFASNKKTVLKMHHEQLGSLTYSPDFKQWETADETIFHSMPGDETGPNKSSVKFLVNKVKNKDLLFNQCAPELLSICHEWKSIDKQLSAKDLFKLSAISVNSEDNDEWEVCFETKPEFKWIYIGLHFKGEEIVANDIST